MLLESNMAIAHDVFQPCDGEMTIRCRQVPTLNGEFSTALGVDGNVTACQPQYRSYCH